MDPSTLTAPTPQDTCHYSLSLPLPSGSLPALIPELLTFVSSLSSSYIWHKQPFNLSLSPLSFSPTTTADTQYLEGKTDCTDCVDDEWFIVWILRELSKNYEGLVVGIKDEDGEFLLIEAAEVLPRWVTPNNATNRVWIHGGRLHLVGIEHLSELPFEKQGGSASFEPDEEGFLDRLTAISLVRDPAVDTLAPTELEDIVFARIDGYPGRIEEHHHKTLAYLPTDIALALSDSPGLVAEAIAAFYEREPQTLRACNTMTRFPPVSPSTAFQTPTLPPVVQVLTTLTRPLYSQLVLQRFFPPKPFEKVFWMLNATGEDERRRNVGMKISCGFEMLYKMSAPQLRISTEFDPSDGRYRVFLGRLEERGYFEGELEGSEKWKRLEVVAREGWKAAKVDRSSVSFAQRVDEAIARSKSRAVPLPTRVTELLDPQSALALEGSEAWLSLDEQGFEEMLKSKGPGAEGLGDLSDDEEDDSDDDEGEVGEEEAERKARKVAKKLEDMANKVQEFVQGRGAVDGAEFSDEQSSDEEDDDEELPTLSPEERAARLATLVTPLLASEWGSSSVPVAPSPASTLPPPKTTLPPRASKLTPNIYEGASDSESSVEDDAGVAGLGLDGEVEEDAPKVIRTRLDAGLPKNAGPTIVEIPEGMDEDEMDQDQEEEEEEEEEDEVNMGGEMDEFLKFATETLGLTEDQYKKILGDREARGAFVPPPPTKSTKSAPKQREPAPPPPPLVREPLKNPNLTDFDALMEKMDAELSQIRAPKKAAAPKKAPKSSDRIVVDSESEDEGPDDEEMGMDAELGDLLKKAGEDAEGGGMDYNLVKNFLESFQSQGGFGFGGPAGNLSGRLGFPLVRDSEEGK